MHIDRTKSNQPQTCINRLKHVFHISQDQFSSNITISTASPLRALTKLMPHKEITVVYCDKHMKHINTLCGQNAVPYNAKVHYKCSKQCVLKELKVSTKLHSSMGYSIVNRRHIAYTSVLSE